MYRFVLTPMNNQLIKLVPMWIAPNLLTLLGLSVMLSAHVLCFLHSPNFDQQLPPWLCMYCALSFYLYQVRVCSALFAPGIHAASGRVAHLTVHRRSTTLTASRRAAPRAPLRWACSLTTAATRSTAPSPRW